jgi:diguanylate cyclase (GGDEF)-like protein
MLDVDHFKQFNDDYGHDIGDRVLCAAVSALKLHFRKRDHISRVGGDEFCIILSDVGQADGPLIREKSDAVNQELALGENHLPPITVSAGVAFWNRPNPRGSLFKDADTALLEVKKSRRG